MKPFKQFLVENDIGGHVHDVSKNLNYDDAATVKDRAAKFVGKYTPDHYKLLWQWVKQGNLSLTTFKALCRIIAKIEQS